jgi:hypothetical protein
MGQVKDYAMEQAENILNVTAMKLVGGDISEDDALEILDKNMDNLVILGFENKFDAIQAVYDLTTSIVGGRV